MGFVYSSGLGCGWHLLGGSGAGVEAEAVAVQRDVEHVRVVIEHVLRAIAVVHVPVEHQHLQRQGRQGGQ